MVLTDRGSLRGLVWVYIIVLNLVLVAGIVTDLTDGRSQQIGSGTSMAHGDLREMGVLDDGDGILVEERTDDMEFVTYYEGQRSGYRTAGDYGDAVTFYINGTDQRFCHRLVCYVVLHRSGWDITADIPELDLYGITEHTFADYGVLGHTFRVDFGSLYRSMKNGSNLVMSGYITKGDHMTDPDTTLGQPLLTVDNIAGKAAPIDRDLSPAQGRSYVGAVVLTVLMLGLSAAWFVKPGGHSDRTLPAAGMIMLVLFLLVRHISIIGNSQTLDVGERAWSMLSALLMVSLVMGVLYALDPSARAGPASKAKLDTALIWLFGPLVYLLFNMGTIGSGYFLVTLLLAASFYTVRPSRFLDGDPGKDSIENNTGAWILVAGLHVVLLFVALSVSVPFIIYAVFGYVIGTGAAYDALKKTR